MATMLPRKLSLSSSRTWISVGLAINALVWYYLVNDLLKGIIGRLSIDSFTSQLIWTSHFAGIIFSAIVGALIATRVKDRKRFFIFWMGLGIVSSLGIAIIDLTYVPYVFFFSTFLGVSLGLGMPSCMGYFTESVEITKRGRMGGIILLLSGITMAIFGVIIGENISLEKYFLSGWRLVGLALLIPLKYEWKSGEKVNIPSYKSLFAQKSFVFYLIPWIMFSLITYLTIPIQLSIVGGSMIELLAIIENVVGAVFAIVGGLLMDIAGRKRMAIAGFVLLGVGYAALGLGDPGNMLGWYFYTVVDGAAWGMLFVIFVVTIWGDLSYNRNSDKLYAIGVLPFFISKFLQYTIGSTVALAIQATSIFSFTAFFLFVAVLPLVYAPETLPEKIMQERELKNYIEKAKKEAAKAEKNKENTQKESEVGEVEFEVGQEDLEKAEGLAEKYY